MTTRTRMFHRARLAQMMRRCQAVETQQPRAAALKALLTATNLPEETAPIGYEHARIIRGYLNALRAAERRPNIVGIGERAEMLQCDMAALVWGLNQLENEHA